MPEVGIKSNTIDPNSFEYPYMSDSIFNTTTMGDYTNLIATLEEEKATEIENNKTLLNEALTNTQKVFENILTASGATKDYKIIFK